jgi:hypothetical protein
MKRITLVIAAIVLAATSASAQSLPEAEAGASAPSQSQAPQTPPGLDGEFVRLARQVPGFGGYFFDANGDLNVHLTDLVREPAARAAVADVARNRPERSRQPWKRPAEVIVHRADYDFVQLAEWRRRLSAALGMASVLVLDADEVANRVFVGVTDEEAKPEVLAVVDRAGVPRAAVVVDVAPAGNLITTLQQYYRPLMGGLEIGFTSASGIPSQCTLGVNVWYTNYAQGIPVGTRGFYTASHCSTTYGGTDGTVFSQGGVQIGHEAWDPPFFTNAQNTLCPANMFCRWSDVAFAAYDAGVNRLQGAVAYTYYRGFGLGQTGSLDIHPNQPSRTLTQTTTPVVGTYLDKVGRTTGWTTGAVLATCIDRTVTPTVRILCQDQVSAEAQGGDSGSPVFRWTGQTTGAFAGIVWYRNQDGTYLFSNLDRIQADMGNGVTYGPN